MLKIDIVLLKIDIVLHGSFVKHKENRDAMEKKHVKNLSRKWTKAIKIMNKN